MTFRQIWEEDDAKHPMMVREDGVTYGSSEVPETKHNSDSREDFHEAGVELKVTPYRINQNGSLSAKERLILTMIDYYQVVNEAFEESYLWNKSKESMSFPTFRFTELIEEDWDDSTFRNYLRETRFLFVVYKFDADDTLRFR